MRSRRCDPTESPSGKLRPLLTPLPETLMDDRDGLRMKRRKYSEGRKDHWFVSESNGLSYASKLSVAHSSRCFVRAA